MSSPHFDGVTDDMSLRGLLFWAVFGLLGFAAFAGLTKPDAPVATLEQTLGSSVQMNRL